MHPLHHHGGLVTFPVTALRESIRMRALTSSVMPPVEDRNDRERMKAIEAAVGQIEKQFGKGSIMRLGGKDVIPQMPSISTGAVSLDYALGIGGVPRGRV